MVIRGEKKEVDTLLLSTLEIASYFSQDNHQYKTVRLTIHLFYNTMTTKHLPQEGLHMNNHCIFSKNHRCTK